MNIDRRYFLKLAGMCSVVFISEMAGVRALAADIAPRKDDFFFIQLSDTHWGFTGPAINPDPTGTLKKAIEAINALKHPPDFIIFTGDLTHVTEDDKERETRLVGFRDTISRLNAKNIYLMPGEHDAALDEGAAFRNIFGKSRYTFDHKGVHFIVLDNVSNPSSTIGEEQLAWLKDHLASLDKSTRIVVFAHRPLFDLYPDWDWHTSDGSKALALLMPYSDVTVFYGHIHQEHHFKTAHISHHAAKGMMYPLPLAGSVPKKQPVPWDAAMPYKGLGYRSVTAELDKAIYQITEYSVKGERL